MLRIRGRKTARYNERTLNSLLNKIYVNPISIVCKYNASSYANTSALATCLDRNMKLANAISQDKSSGSFIFYKQLL